MANEDFSGINKDRIYKIKDNGKAGGNYGLYLMDDQNNENLIGFINGRNKALLIQRILNGNESDVGGSRMMEAIALDKAEEK